jgi:hypothetical protein
MFVLWLVQFTSLFWEQRVGLEQHTIRTWSIHAYQAWTALEVLLAAFRVRHWDFPFRIGRRPPPAAHA